MTCMTLTKKDKLFEIAFGFKRQQLVKSKHGGLEFHEPYDSWKIGPPRQTCTIVLSYWQSYYAIKLSDQDAVGHVWKRMDRTKLGVCRYFHVFCNKKLLFFIFYEVTSYECFYDLGYLNRPSPEPGCLDGAFLTTLQHRKPQMPSSIKHVRSRTDL